jgi:hypothetical protein
VLPYSDITMLNAFKDKFTSKAAQAHCNTLLARYGNVTELRIDSAQRRMEVVCQLEGEASPIAVTVERYEITDERGEKFVHVAATRCARPWVQHFLEDHIYGRKFPLPSWAAAAL